MKKFQVIFKNVNTGKLDDMLIAAYTLSAAKAYFEDNYNGEVINIYII